MMENDNPFGTPPCKLFLKSKEFYSSEDWEAYLRLSMKTLVERNEKMKADAHLEIGLACEATATLISGISEKIGLSPCTKYLAVDIYQRFILKHIESLLKLIKEQFDNDKERNEQLAKVQKRVSDQSPLRVLTCLWIATKLSDHKKGLSRDDIHKTLTACGIEVQPKTINKSELRILESIGYDCHRWLPIPGYIGVLVAFITEQSQSTDEKKLTQHFTADDLYKTSLHITDFVLLNYEKVYMEIFHKTTNLKVVHDTHKPAFAKVKCDRLLLTTSSVVAAGWLHGSDELCTIFTQKLSPVTRLPTEDIHSFATCLLKIIFLTGPEECKQKT